jgi:hypothetical protein
MGWYWDELNLEQARALAGQLNKHWMSLEHSESPLDDQKYRCVTCKRPMWECAGGLVINHGHKTGGNRELLCIRCNTDLGKWEWDDAEERLLATATRLLACVNYIRWHKCQQDITSEYVPADYSPATRPYPDYDE